MAADSGGIYFLGTCAHQGMCSVSQIKISCPVPTKPPVAKDFVPDEKDGGKTGRREVRMAAWAGKGDSLAAGT